MSTLRLMGMGRPRGCLLAAAMFSLLCASAGLAGPAEPAPKPPIVKVHEGKCWTWYARQDQYDEHRKDSGTASGRPRRP